VQILTTCLVKAVLEDGERPGALGEFDADCLELVVLALAPYSQSLVSCAWALLGEGRRSWLGLLDAVEQHRMQKLPDTSGTNQLGLLEKQFCSLAKFLRKVLT
jgi:hypothetical protein